MIVPNLNIESLKYNINNNKLSEFIEDQIFSALSVIRIELENLESRKPDSKRKKYPNLSLILDWQQHSKLERNYNVFKVSDSLIEFTSIFDDITHLAKICDGTFNSFIDELNHFTSSELMFKLCKDEIDEINLINSIVNRIYKRKLIFTGSDKIKEIAKEYGDKIKFIIGKNNKPPSYFDFTIEEIWLENTSGKGGEPLVINWNIKLKSLQINTPVGFKGKAIPNRKII